MAYITIKDKVSGEIIDDISIDDEDACAEALGNVLFALAHDMDVPVFIVEIENVN